jgi:hypothetical protein
MFTTRMARLRERMTETGTDLVVIGPTSSMVWLAGLSPHGDERRKQLGPVGSDNSPSSRSVTACKAYWLKSRAWDWYETLQPA